MVLASVRAGQHREFGFGPGEWKRWQWGSIRRGGNSTSSNASEWRGDELTGSRAIELLRGQVRSWRIRFCSDSITVHGV
jgi:hypothetical protein